MMKTAAFTVPLEHRDQANEALHGAGFGPGNFSLLLSPLGEPPATHCAMSGQFSDGDLLTLDSLLDGFGALVFFAGDGGGTPLENALAQTALTRIIPEEDP